MKRLSIPAFVLLATALTACGDFEWFPPVSDTTPPNLYWRDDKGPFTNNTANLSTPRTISVSGNDSTSNPVTIYYTTNGSTPTTSSLTYSQPVTVSDSSWVLSFIGYDKATVPNWRTITLKFK